MLIRWYTKHQSDRASLNADYRRGSLRQHFKESHAVLWRRQIQTTASHSKGETIEEGAVRTWYYTQTKTIFGPGPCCALLDGSRCVDRSVCALRGVVWSCRWCLYLYYKIIIKKYFFPRQAPLCIRRKQALKAMRYLYLGAKRLIFNIKPTMVWILKRMKTFSLMHFVHGIS